MNRLSIGGRIYLAVGVVVTLMAAISAVSYFETSTLAGVFTDYRSTARQTLKANEQIEDLFEARLAAFGYRVNPSDERAADVDHNIDEILENADSVREMFAGDALTEGKLRDIEQSAAKYKAAFERMVQLQKQRNKFVAEIARLGPKARKQLTSIMESAYSDGDPQAAYYAGLAQQELMLGRFYQERFLLSNEEEAYQRATGHLTTANENLSTLLGVLENPGRRQNATATVADIEGYLFNAEEVRSVIKERNNIRIGQLDVIGPKMQAAYEVILDEVVDRQNTLGPEGSETAARILIEIGIMSLFSLLVGVIAAGAIARWTSGSVRSTADAMTQLANGDLNIVIKGTEQEHELGMMAKALQVFKDNAQTTKRMQDEKEAAAKAEAQTNADKRQRDEALGKEIVDLVEKVTSGDLANRLSTQGREGILAEVCGQINRLVDGLEAVLKDVGEKMEALAEGDLGQRITANYQGAFGDLKTSVNRTADQLSEIVVEIQTAAGQIKDASAEINSGTEDLSNRTEKAASNLEETAASMEEMSATVKQTAHNSTEANQLAETANQAAGKGGTVVEQAVKAMDGIESSARKITDIISVIDEIAFQTNLLALNASVEAARAGEAGKGFAVVAQEVRQLAQRSAQAASDIKVLIQDSNGQVKNGVELVNQAGQSLAEIVGSIGQVAEIIQGISSASQEQASGVQEINSSVASMDEMTQQNSALVEQSAASARALGDQANKLGELMAFFKSEHGGQGSRPASTATRSVRPPSPSKPVSASAPAFAGASGDGWDEF
ncbi:MAG: methyl-accepting chemotaxis protein [Pseudomonadota bacterium]